MFTSILSVYYTKYDMKVQPLFIGTNKEASAHTILIYLTEGYSQRLA